MTGTVLDGFYICLPVKSSVALERTLPAKLLTTDAVLGFVLVFLVLRSDSRVILADELGDIPVQFSSVQFSSVQRSDSRVILADDIPVQFSSVQFREATVG
jgi:hypothetical protein